MSKATLGMVLVGRVLYVFMDPSLFGMVLVREPHSTFLSLFVVVLPHEHHPTMHTPPITRPLLYRFFEYVGPKECWAKSQEQCQPSGCIGTFAGQGGGMPELIPAKLSYQ